MKNILVICGTRPEAIKLAPVVRALREPWAASLARTWFCASGQHREMLQQAFDSLDLQPDERLEVMQAGQSLAQLSARLIVGLDALLARHQPDWVVVQGDTTTALMGALAAYYRRVPVAHVEAGLRTRDLANPFPEEANRQLVARVAALHFAPTARARAELVAEGIVPQQTIVTGNTVIDAIDQMRSRWNLPDHVAPARASLPDELAATGQPLVLVTCHRRESFGETLRQICVTLRQLCALYPELQWVFPVHLNPQVREAVYSLLGDIPNLRLCEPVDYDTSLRLIAASCLILTDSGGIQEEAPSFGVPVVIMREHTERIEGVNAGFAILAGTQPQAIMAAARHWLDRPELTRVLRERLNPYGDGRAGQRIARHLLGLGSDEFA